MEVQQAIGGPNEPPLDVIEALKLPERGATSYRAMYTHGMHFRVQSAENDKVTCDSGVAASVVCRTVGRLGNESQHWGSHEYVGSIEEILELNYRSH